MKHMAWAVLALLFWTGTAQAEPVILFAQFKGTAKPVEGIPGALIVEAKSLAAMDGGEAKGLAKVAKGEKASFESRVLFLTEESFTESGRITFGDRGTLQFQTLGQGAIKPSPREGTAAGAVVWTVVGGTGEFEGMKGTITSNFTVDDEGVVTDNQVHVLFNTKESARPAQ